MAICRGSLHAYSWPRRTSGAWDPLSNCGAEQIGQADVSRHGTTKIGSVTPNGMRPGCTGSSGFVP